MRAWHDATPLADVPVIIRVSSSDSVKERFEIKKGLRRRRSPRPIYYVSLPENTKLGLVAGKKIPLNPAEEIQSSPSDSKHFHIHPNGSLELTKELNFEAEPQLQFSVVVENKKTKGKSLLIVLWFVVCCFFGSGDFFYIGREMLGSFPPLVLTNFPDTFEMDFPFNNSLADRSYLGLKRACWARSCE